MADDTGVALIIIRFGRFGHECDATPRNLVRCIVKIARADSDVLNALAIITLEVFDDLPRLTPVFVDRNADAPAGTGQRATAQSGVLSFDVKEAEILLKKSMFWSARC